ncbi:MAG: aldo/keto reductase, partial [Actinomycetes bacterium]
VIDVYQLHGGVTTAAQAEDVVAVLETLADEGTVRWYGTAVDAPDIVRVFARAPRVVAVQTQVNVFGRTDAVLDAARECGLAVLARSPLAMGLLGGGYDVTRRPAAGDVRLDTPWWDYFDEASMPEWLDRLASVRELLTSGGRTLAQGALSYLLGLGVVPIPGARTQEQAQENAAALAHGPLADGIVTEIDELLADSPERR